MTEGSPAGSTEFSVTMDATTRERISKLASDKRRSAKSKHERKNAVFSSLDTMNDDEIFTPTPPSRVNSEPRPKARGSKRVLPSKRSDDMSMSEHSKRSNGREENVIRRISPRKSDPGNGKLGQMLEGSERRSKRGARSVASPTRRHREPSMRGERSGRSKSPGAMKGRISSGGPGKKDRSKRSNSLGPLKKERRKRPSGTMKEERKSSSSPSRRRPSLRRAKSNRSTRLDSRTLEEKLGGIDPGSQQKRRGGSSVVSAPAISRNHSASRRSRRPSSKANTNSSRRARSADNDQILLENNITESPKAQAQNDDEDEMSLGDFGELNLNDDDEKDTTKATSNLSQRLSRRLGSFIKLAGIGSSKSIGGHQKHEALQSDEDGQEQRSPSRRARNSKRLPNRARRSNSAGPLGGRPKREDRRAGLSKAKRGNGAADDADSDDKSSRGPPPRAQSMMLHREATRRGKSTSLLDLQQYKEEEIHSTSYFASNHVLVNRERMKRGLRPLTRNIAMDEVARETAQKMADSEGKSSMPATYVGNVVRGESIRAIHRSIMQNKEGRERQNLLSPYFQDFGVGTSKGKDGMLYVCQLFSERIELTITDTT